VVEHAAEVLRETGDLALASKAVIFRALATNSKDNISCMMVTMDAVKARHEKEFHPGQLFTTADNSGFQQAWEAMAERAGKTFAEGAEVREREREGERERERDCC
jgi:organic hydroperoxide reductase OsmC/OhrA